MPRHLTILTGASRGLGLAIARQLLASPDCTLLCMSRSTNAGLTALADATGATLEQWARDLADGAGAAQAMASWLQTHAAIAWASATLINNAGVISALAPLRQGNLADLTQALRVGVEAPLLLCSAFLGATLDWTAPRKVLNISSGLGRRAMASSATYCAAKAGMDHFTRCLALEEALLTNGAKVCSLAPGVIDTDMQDQLRHADASLFPDRALFEGMHANNQLSSPADTAARVLAYLARADFGTQPVGDVRE
jgi:NAD(P)-dependent dehydrogenase (short-subunit alcohol dehydrogenase family)